MGAPRDPGPEDHPPTVIGLNYMKMLLEPVPIVSVLCDGATWQGEPERGFWCYEKPVNPGPTGMPILPFFIQIVLSYSTSNDLQLTVLFCILDLIKEYVQN